MVLMVFFSSRISPFTSTVILRDRSPLATAVVTSAMLRTWPVRLPAIELTRVGQVLPGAGDALHLGLAAELAVGADLARDARHLGGEGAELVHHGVDGVLQLQQLALDVDGDLLRKVAARHGGGHVGDVAHLAGQVAGHRVHVLGQVLPGAGHALHVGLAAELAFGADLAGDARHLGRERAQLVHHGVDGVLQLQQLALDVDGDLLRQVAARHGGGHVGDVAHLAGQVAGHGVHAVGQVLPGAGDALHLGLSAELAFGADLAGNARHLGGKGAELFDHGVDGAGGAQEFALERAAFDLERHALGEVALGHRADHARHLAGGVHQVLDQRVDGFDRIPPEAGDIAQRGPLLELAFLAHHPAQARQLLLFAGIELDHVVEGVGDLAPDAGPVERQAGRGVALFYSQQGFQKLDRPVVGVRTGIGSVSLGCAVALCQLVEKLGDFSSRAVPVLRQAN